MEWYSGELSSGIQKVKQDRTLLFVFSKDESQLSTEILTTLDKDSISSLCKDAVCFQLEATSTPFAQFSSVYEVPSVPCIHLILPAGSILSIRASEFAEDQLICWLTEQMKAFQALSDVKIGPTTPVVDSTISVVEPTIPVEEPTSSTEPKLVVDVEVVKKEGTGNSTLEERMQLARQKLEKKRQEDTTKEFTDTYETEIERRNLGKKMSEFKERQRQDEIKEQLEERRRTQAADKAARARILQQIELDRQERFGNATISPPVPPPRASPLTTASRISPSPNETRLQLRLPEGAAMTAVFSADATLGGEVRQLISHKVFPTVDMDADSNGSPPLSDSVRNSFEPIVKRGYIFKQMIPPRQFSPDEEGRTLRELDLLPSAVLVLIRTSGGPGPLSAYSNGSFLGYSQDLLSQLFNVLTSGLQAGATFLYGLGQDIWHMVFRTSGGERTVARTEIPTMEGDERAPSPRTWPPKPSGSNAYRRQGQVNRLSHMPDDTDEEARWNGNSTTQL